jgi:hypothetical protein
MKYRDLIKMQGPNDGSRTLFESVMSTEVIAALENWKKANVNGVLIGGLALSYYVKPRSTQDIDVLMLSDADIPKNVFGFKRTRKHAFQDNVTHVEVEIVTPEYVKMPIELAKQIFDTAVEENGFKIASAGGLIAAKLGRFNIRDRGDIVDLIKCCDPDISNFLLTKDQKKKYKQCVKDAEKEKNLELKDEELPP